MTRPRTHVGGALFAFGIVVGAAISLNLGGGADEELETEPAVAGTGPIVFYSGQEEAGIRSADQYSGWEFAEDNRFGGFHWSDWNGDEPVTCNPDRADDFPSDRGLHVLVGYSSGRVGVVNFLRAAEDRWGEIDTIYLLDPGVRATMMSGCDSRMPELPTAYLERWLSRDSNRRLIIVSSAWTNSDAREGLNEFYLGSMFRSSQAVADRTLVCIDKANTSHGRVDDVFMNWVANNHDRNCPDDAHRDMITVTPPPTTAPATAQPPLTTSAANDQAPPTTAPATAQPPLTTSTANDQAPPTTAPATAQPPLTTSTTNA